MTWATIDSLEELHGIYGSPGEAALLKVARQITPLYRKWLSSSRFCILSTTGPEGTDASPRGDSGPVARELDPKTLALPDWRGNNRLDSLRNIVRDDRVSLLFMVNGNSNVVRVNGRAKVSADQELRAKFERDGIHPATVTLIRIDEIYSQCARAILRSGLWTEAGPADLPSVGDILREQARGEFDGSAYDREWPERASGTMW